MSDRAEELLARLRAEQETDTKAKRSILWFLAVIGGITIIAGIVVLVIKLLRPDYLEDGDEEFDDDFDDFFAEEAEETPDSDKVLSFNEEPAENEDGVYDDDIFAEEDEDLKSRPAPAAVLKNVSGRIREGAEIVGDRVKNVVQDVKKKVSKEEEDIFAAEEPAAEEASED